ncbi:hypothetical protein [Methanospirillum lacunae]
MSMSSSTIQIPESTIHALDHLKAYPNETYAEVIERLIVLSNTEDDITPEEWARIQQAETEYKNGKTYTLDELKRRLGDE